MNHQIRILAEQATKKYDRLGNEIPFAQPDLEKFAELIVAECLEACSRANEIRHFVPPTQEQVVLSCMREIETTFRS
jgi:hypothetical protein